MYYLRSKIKLRIDGIYGILKNLIKVLAFESNIDIDKNITRNLYIQLLFSNPTRVFKALVGTELIIGHTDVVLTTVCTLKCKGCGALIDYNNHQCHYNVDDIIESLQHLIDAVNHIHRVHLLGGEPLCFPHLFEVMSFLHNQEKVNIVGITTNGTLLIKDKRVLELLRDKKFQVDISSYGESVSKKQAQLIQQLKENHIKYILHTKGDSWIDFGGFNRRNRSEERLYKIFSDCQFKWCRPIIDGKMFRCTRSAHGTKMGLIPLETNEYVDLSRKDYPSKKLKKELYKFLYSHTHYLISCDYCDMEPPLKHIEAGVQMRGDNGLRRADANKTE